MSARAVARRHALAAACAAALLGLASAAALTLAPSAGATAPTCSTSTAAVTPLHRPASDLTTMRPFYSATDGVNDSGYAGWELSGPGLGADTWVRLSGFSGGSLGLAAHQSASIPARAVSQNGKPLIYAYLTAPSATSTAQTFTVEVWNGKPGQAGSTEVCTYADGFSSVIKTISANANKITSVDVSNSSPAIGGTFSITGVGSTGTMGSGDPSDRVAGNGPFSMAPAMADSWPADAFTLTGVTLSLQGATTHDVLRTYPVSSASSSYTAVYDFTVRGTTSGATSVLPVQNIASGTQVKYTGSFPTTVSQISAPTITTTVSKTVQSFASHVVTYRVDVQNSSSGATTLDSLQDTPTPTSGWTLVAGSAALGGATIADPAVSSDHSTLFFEGPFTVPAASGGTPGKITITYELQLSAAVSNSVIATVGGEALGATGGGTANQVTVDPAAPVIATASLASATVGTAYSQTLTATNGTAPYQWSVASGSLPAGLSLSTGGAISGIPTGSGSSTFAVQVADASSKTATATFTVAVASGADTTAPQNARIVLDGGAATTTSSTVTLDLSATDDVGVTAYRIAEGSSCAGASWSGVSSAASYAGTASFTVSSGDGSKTVCVQYEDAAGNVSATATASIVLDTPPTVSLASAAPDPTSAPFTVTATFSKSVTGFSSSGITVGNGTLSGLAGSGATYSFTVSPTSDGAVTVDVGAGAAVDAANVGNTAATQLSRGYSRPARPTVVLTATAASPTNAPFTVAATFSSSVSGFDASDVAVANGTVSDFSGSGADYSFTVSPAADGIVTVDVADGAAADAGNATSTASNTLTRDYDGTAPTPTLASASAGTVSGAFDVTVSFSETVTGFAATGIAATNATVSGLTGSGGTYSVRVTPTAAGSVRVSVPAGAAQDAAGNESGGSNMLDRTYTVVSTTTTTTETTTASGPAATPAPVATAGLATTTARAAETDPAATAPAPAPDIQIAMTSSRQQVTAGETFTTTVTATNVGDGTANDVALHIALPVDTEFVSGRAALVDGARRTAALRRPTADDSWPCHVSSRVVTCPVGEMTPSAKYVVDLNLRALQTGVLVVQADTTASNATSRRAQVKVKANPAHVELVARLQTSERGGNVQLDERYTATVVVANTGGTSAREVAVSLDVPAGSSYVGASADGAQCRVADGTLVCTVARLAPGASRRIEVRLHANARGKVRLAVSGRSANQAHIGSRFVILPAVPQTVGFTAVVYFSSGSAFLSARARRELDLTAHEVATGRLSRATLSCNTDDVGSLTYNFALSRARCQAVAGYLARTGQLRRIRYAEHAWAYLRPAASNASSAGRARNRRVEIRID